MTHPTTCVLAMWLNLLPACLLADMQAQVTLPDSTAASVPGPPTSSSGPAAVVASAAPHQHTDLTAAVEQQSSLALDFSSGGSSPLGRPLHAEELMLLPSEPQPAAMEAAPHDKVLVGAPDTLQQQPVGGEMQAAVLDGAKLHHQQLVASHEHVGQATDKAGRRKMVGRDDNWWHPWGESVAAGYGYDDV
jgi:hypothetical protein